MLSQDIFEKWLRIEQPVRIYIENFFKEEKQ